MMNKKHIFVYILMAAVTPVDAVENLIQNDSLVDFGTGSIQSGFVNTIRIRC